jgi:hypothetical protein
VVYQQDGVGFSTNLSDAGFSKVNSSVYERFSGIVDYTNEIPVSSVGYSTSLLVWTWSASGGGGPNIGGVGPNGNGQYIYDASLRSAGMTWSGRDTDSPRHGSNFGGTITVSNMSMPVSSTFRVKGTGYTSNWTITTTSGTFNENSKTTEDGWFVFNNYAGRTITQLSASFDTGRRASGFNFSGLELDGVFQTIGRTSITSSSGIAQTSFPPFAYLQNKHSVGIGSTTYIGKVLGVSGSTIYLDDDIASSGGQTAVGGAIGVGETLVFAFQPPAEWGITHGYVSGYGGPYLEVYQNDLSPSSNYTVDYFYCNYKTATASVATNASSAGDGVWKHGRYLGSLSGNRNQWTWGNSSSWQGYLTAIRVITDNDSENPDDVTLSNPESLFDPSGSGQYPRQDDGTTPKSLPLNLYADYNGDPDATITNFNVPETFVSVAATNTLRLNMPTSFSINGVGSTDTTTVYSLGANIQGFLRANSSESPYGRKWSPVSFASTIIQN